MSSVTGKPRARWPPTATLTPVLIPFYCLHLSMAVLARLGGGHLDDLAWPALQHHVAVLTQGGALGRIRQ